MKNIFVSSTFRDMQAERDLIQKEVLPQLKAKAKAYGENMNMIDLRWGVDTSELESEEGSMKVMSVCLDEVERSRPHMLIFLGERYGSIIDPAITERVIARKDSQFKLDDYAISITAMEVEFGMLSQQIDSMENCVVCMRSFSPEEISDEAERAIYQAEDVERKAKQQAFKEKVVKKVQGRVIEYTCDWDEEKKQLVNFQTTEGVPLSEKLLTTYEAMFEKRWQELSALSWEEKEQLTVDALQESKLRAFSGRNSLINRYYNQIIRDNGVLVLQGEVGSGKTSIMCKLMKQLSWDGKKVFRFVAGNSSMSETAMQLVQQLVYYLEEICAVSHYKNREKTEEKASELEVQSADKQSEFDGWLERLGELLARLDQDERIYIVVDALDLMHQDENLKYLKFVLNNPKVRYVLSCTKEFEISMLTNGTNLVIEKIPVLSKDDVISVIDGLLMANSKNTYKAIQEAILTKKSNDNPLYISMLIQRLNMMSQDDLYDAKTERDIILHSYELIDCMPDSIKEAAVFLLEEAVRRFETEENALLDVVNLLAVSRNGLRERDIQIIMLGLEKSVSQLDISRLRHYLDSFFVIHEDGRINFTHKVIRQGLLQKNVENGQYQKYVNAIAARVKSLKNDDEFWKSEGMFYARMSGDVSLAEEIIVYAYKNNDLQVLEAIKAEGLADSGEFYANNMDRMIGAKAFFAYGLSSYNNTKEELLLQEKLLRRFVEWIEQSVYEKKNFADPFEVFEAYQYLGIVLIKQDKIDEAEANLKKTHAICSLLKNNKRVKEEKLAEPLFLLNLFLIYLNFGDVYAKKGMYEKALAFYEDGLKVANEICGNELMKQKTRYLRLCYQEIGTLWLAQKDAEKALDYFEQAFIICKKNYEVDHDLNSLAALAMCYTWMARAYRDMKKENMALTNYLQSAEHWETIYAERRNLNTLRSLIDTYFDTATLLKGINQKKEAVSYYRKAAEGLEELCKKDKNAYITYYKVAKEMEASTDEEENFYYWKKSVEILEELYKISSNIGLLKKAFDSAGYILDAAKDKGKTGDVIEYQEKCLNMATEIYRIDKSPKMLDKVGTYTSKMGDYYLKKGNKKQALEYYNAALKIREELYQLTQDIYELLWYGRECRRIAKVFKENKMSAEAIEYCEKGVEIARTIYDKRAGYEMEIFEAYEDLAAICVCFGMLEEGLCNYKNALRYREMYCIGSEETKRLYEAFQENAKLRAEAEQQGDKAKELEYAEKGLDIAVKELGPRKALAELPDCNDKIANILELLERPEEALNYYVQALHVRKKYGNGSMIKISRDLATSYSNIGKVLQKLGRVKEAREYCETACVYVRQMQTEEYSFNMNIKLKSMLGEADRYMQIGKRLRQHGKLWEALEYHRKALNLKEQLYNSGAYKTTLRDLAFCYYYIEANLMELGRTKEALEYAQKAYKSMREFWENETGEGFLYEYICFIQRVIKCNLAVGSYEKCEAYFMEAKDHLTAYETQATAAKSAEMRGRFMELYDDYLCASGTKD